MMKFRLVLAALAALLPAASLAQSFPQQRPITLVVPFAPGGGTDSISRELAKHLQDKRPLLLVANRETGIASVAQLVDAARKNPDSLNYVSAGQGSINHLAGELFVQRTGAKMTHIPYKGSGPATLDLIGGNAQVFFATVPTILGQVKGEKVRLIAATSAARARLFPDTPTVDESGVKGFNVETWWGVVGPAGMPADIVRILNKAINDAAASAELRRRFENEGADPFSGTPADFGNVLKDELEGWRKVVREGGLKLD